MKALPVEIQPFGKLRLEGDVHVGKIYANRIMYIRMFFIFFVAITFFVDHENVNAQAVRQIDTARFKEIVYPPLTVREGKDLTLPVPPAGHPRLFFRKSDLPAIKARMEHPMFRDCWERVRKNAATDTDGKFQEGDIFSWTGDTYNTRILNAIEAKAFMYAFTGDQKTGNEAVDLIFNVHNTVVINTRKSEVWRDIAPIIFVTSVVYDWCYDLISPAERKSLIAIMESLAADMAIRWPRLVQGSVTGHGVESQLARDMLSVGIATYDEKPEIYRRAAGRLFAEFIPAQNFGYLSGRHHQGSSYASYRFQYEMLTTLLFDRMGYPGVTGKNQGTVPYQYIYSRRPDGQVFREGDDNKPGNRPGTYSTFPNLAYVASYYQDPLLMGEAIREGSIGRSLYDLLLIDLNVQADFGITALPLARYFPYPYGGMAVRTSWDKGSTADAVVAEMKIGAHHFANHAHLDAGSFQLYYKGPLAVESGIYQGVEGGYGSDHFKNYYQRTIAHNCMLVYNPDEIFMWNRQPAANDGGQRFPAEGIEPANLDVVLSDEYKKGEIVAYDFSPDPVKPEYSYLKGDITQAYTDKVKNHQRSFVFLNLDNAQVPAALIVYDYIAASDKNYKKTWLMHCVQEPVFNGNVCTVVRNEKGYNGKLVNTVLLPLPPNTLLEKTGGPGHEYSVGGINYPNRLPSENNSDDGVAWRIELSPKTLSETDIFLNVMQITEADNTRLLPVEKIETDQLTGVQIGDRIVLFSKNGNLENNPVNLSIKGAGSFKVLITDLEKGTWDISGPKSPGMVRNNVNFIYFQAIAGNYTITKI